MHCWDSDKFCGYTYALLRIQMDRLGLCSDRRAHFASVCVNSCWSWFKIPARKTAGFGQCYSLCVVYKLKFNSQQTLQHVFFDCTQWAQIKKSWWGEECTNCAKVVGGHRFHATRLETRTKESNMCASLRVKETRSHNESKGCLQLKWDLLLTGSALFWPTYSTPRKVWVRAHLLGGERWWTMLE